MESSESSSLLASKHDKKRIFSSGLNVTFAIICIIDVFGVFPIIALPKSIIDCGLYGIFAILCVCSVQIYTATLLGRCWLIAEEIDPNIEDKNRYPYSALAELAFGTKFSGFVTVLLDFTIFGGGIPNLIVASQTLQLLGLRLTEGKFDMSFCYWIIIVGMILCPLLWLGSPKDMKLICTMSVLMVLIVFILVWGSIIFDNSALPLEIAIDETPLIERMIKAYGIIAFQFDIHPMILTIHVDMKEKKKIRNAILGGFGASLGMFSITATAAYLKYGRGIHSSLLGDLPPSISLHFSALMVALQLALTSAVGNSALYQHMEDCLGISREFNHKRCLLRTTLSLAAIVIAESVPRLDLVMSLIGGTLIGPLVFILPPLIFIKIASLKKAHEEAMQLETFRNVVYSTGEIAGRVSAYMEDKFQNDFKSKGARSGCEVIICILVVIFGICSTTSTTYLNIRNSVQYATFSQPCIYNLTLVSPF